MIEIENLTKRYGSKTVLDHVSFRVNDGEILGLLGPNGAGKSTTMNILTGNLAASEGTVKIGGYEIQENPREAKAHLGYLPELPPLYMDMTVEEYMNFIYRLKHCRLPKKEHLQEVCAAAQIGDVQKRLIRNLSKGYRQRVGIAQALVNAPEVLILDEPTVGLDPRQMMEIRQLIMDLGKKHTVILSSHILSDVQAVCDRVVVINQGQMIADDTPENLSKNLNGSCLSMTAEGPEEEITEMLKSIEGVQNVMHRACELPGCCSLEIHTEAAVDLRRPVAQAMKDSPWLMLELSETGASLEDIFMQLTNRKKGGKKA